VKKKPIAYIDIRSSKLILDFYSKLTQSF